MFPVEWATLIALAHGDTPTLSVDAVLVLGAAACQALFFVLQRPLLDRYSGFEVTCYATWTGTLVALPATPHLVDDLAARPDGAALAAVVFLGVGSSAIGFVTWAYAQRRVTVTVAAATNTLYLAPASTVVLGWITLGEVPGAVTVVGGALVVAGVVVSRRRPTPATR